MINKSAFAWPIGTLLDGEGWRLVGKEMIDQWFWAPCAGVWKIGKAIAMCGLFDCMGWAMRGSEVRMNLLVNSIIMAGQPTKAIRSVTGLGGGAKIGGLSVNVDLHWLVIRQMEFGGLTQQEKIEHYRPMRQAAEDPANMMRFWGVVTDFWEHVDRYIDYRIKWRIDIFVDRVLAGKNRY